MNSENTNLIIYKSSAGSGKTTTLVKEYLTLALKSPYYFKSILAVTFTNKAANEMKKRVLEHLYQLSNPDLFEKTYANTVLIDFLTTQLNSSKEEIREKAEKCLQIILHNYDGFMLKTIDSFVSNLVRSFTKDLDLPDNFEIELDEKNILNKAIDNILSNIKIDDDVNKTLVNFLENQLNEEKGLNFKEKIINLGEFLYKEDSAPFLEKLSKLTFSKVNEVSNKINKFIENTDKAFVSLGKKALEILSQNNITNKDLYYGDKGIYGYFKKSTISDFNSYSQKTISEDKWYSDNVKSEIKDRIDNIASQLKEIALKMQELYLKNRDSYFFFQNVKENIILSSLYHLLFEEIQNIYKEEKIYPLSEINRMISNIVIDEDAPFIYERIGNKFQNILIDEFQDTSELQWKEFLPLIINSLSQGHKNLIVGDAKQAIYRFRNGNVEQFIEIPNLPKSLENSSLKDSQSLLTKSTNIVNLDSNYRSKKEIVEFNNLLFDFLKQNSDDYIKNVYENHTQKYRENNTGGYVEINFIDNQNDDEKLSPFYDKIESLIPQILKDGYEYSDIAILVNKNKEASDLVNFLYSKNIEATSQSSLTLIDSPKVLFIVNFLNHIIDPDDKVFISSILNFLAKNNYIKPDLNSQLQYIAKNSLSTFLGENNIYIDIESLKKLSNYDLVEKIIRIFNLNPTSDPFIDSFRDFVLSSITKFNTIEELVNEWNQSKENLGISSPESLNAVRVQTIHKSKGLEFPVVIWLAIDNNNKKLVNSYRWVYKNDKEIQDDFLYLFSIRDYKDNTENPIFENETIFTNLERINKLYVASTRPIDMLYVLANENDKNYKQTDLNLNAPSLFLKKFIDENADFFTKIDENSYSYGKFIRQNMTLKNNNINKSIVYDEMPKFPDWHNRLNISVSKLKIFNENSKEIEWGNCVHETLSIINDLSETENIIKNQSINYNLSDEKISDLKNITLQFLNNENFINFYDKNSEWKPYSEISILNTNGKLFRPDKIFIKNNNEAVIIEFKTGLILDSHQKQLYDYVDLLKKMGYNISKKYLVYLHNSIIIKEIN